MRDRDPNRHRLYVVDRIFWVGAEDGKAFFTEYVPLSVWAAYAESVFSDGLRRPYTYQIRRRRRTPALTVQLLPDDSPYVALASLQADRLEVQGGRLQRWLVLHEVAHLLVPACTAQPHHWRFVNVYAEMIHRHLHQKGGGHFLSLSELLGVEWKPPPGTRRRTPGACA